MTTSLSHAQAAPADVREVTIEYDDRITQRFMTASVVWGIVGLLVGALVALQLAFWQANLGPYLSFGRLRPLHTNAVIFAFVGNMIFAGIYYSTQRLLKARLASDALSRFHFWGWQAIIVAAAVTLPLGFTQAKEYAELEWPIDLAIAVVWVAFAVNFFWTLAKRREKQLYVAVWFYIATIIAITVLHVVNSLSIPVFALKSYSLFSGVQDALVQWWYGHNAVAFFLTTPVLGIMYYFLPKAADRPVYSYRLSIIHFWALVFIYIWAGPHHLLYTALPDWAQTLGMLFSLMLWAPSWGGMLNGLLTLKGAWQKVRTDPVLKFFAAGVTFYGMATFEGPLLSIKSVSGLAHYTDWIVAHVHAGALGWNGFMAAGMFYYLYPRIYRTKLYSRPLADLHFYIGTVGILLYVTSMWVSGITQGLMWRAQNEGGGLLYPNFVETLIAIKPMYWTRLVGGTLYLVGFVIMGYNLWRTAQSGELTDESVQVTELVKSRPETPWRELAFGKPVVLTVVLAGLLALFPITDPLANIMLIAMVLGIGVLGIVLLQVGRDGRPGWHALLEGRAAWFSGFTVLAVLVGGVAELVPSIISGNRALAGTTRVPYTALELEGRDVYLKEGCYNCHSQMIRPFTWETARYGEVSRADESIFDHPFQWGSKRTGPDLARVGGKYNHQWHYHHMIDPREISPGSNMPAYAHLAENTVAFEHSADKMRALRTAGVPYKPEQLASAEADARKQSDAIALELTQGGERNVIPNSELVALISYLQRLGKEPTPAAPNQGKEPISMRQGGL
ncbi:MAG TPA: cytochrome-c oxidase, cbb3-type subunit I [Polyangiales bacterium]